MVFDFLLFRDKIKRRKCGVGRLNKLGFVMFWLDNKEGWGVCRFMRGVDIEK